MNLENTLLKARKLIEKVVNVMVAVVESFLIRCPKVLLTIHVVEGL